MTTGASRRPCVHFVGAGPGAVDLLTLRAARLLDEAELLLYAGSLVPAPIIALAQRAEKHDTASMTLGQIVPLLRDKARAGSRVVRLHSGDPSLYGAIAEQIRLLEGEGIACPITPGVPAFVAAAARLGQELTLPDVSQTVILTRTSVRSSSMPIRESLAVLAQSGATLAIHLGIANLAVICRTLTPFYGSDCPVVVASRIGWSEELILRGTLSDIRAKVKRARLVRGALIFVGRVLSVKEQSNAEPSRLYSSTHSHVFRKKSPT